MPTCTFARAYRHLKPSAVPSRDKLAHMVAATDLLALGISLMETWASGPPQRAKQGVPRYRDGLIIALLIACPMRLKNLANLVIGQHLVFDGCGYWLKLTAADTKTGRPYVGAVPAELTSYIDGWLQVHRARLKLMARGEAYVGSTGGHLWLDRGGRPMRSKAIRDQIKSRTRQAFGKAIWPHLFRDCAVTELVDCAPEEIGIAADLLGHANLRTTTGHYIKAKGMTAHARIQEVIARRRAAVDSRA